MVLAPGLADPSTWRQMNTERDKFLTKKVLGKCWQGEVKFQRYELYARASPTFTAFMQESPYGEYIKYNDQSSTDFSTWPGFGLLWEGFKKWAHEHKQWDAFLDEYGNYLKGYRVDSIDIELVNPDRFADAVWGFLKEK